MRCPKCGNRVFQTYPEGGGVARIHGPLRVNSSGEVKARCYSCKEAVTLPIKAEITAEAPPKRYVINRGS